MEYVYILRCADDTLYTGWTNDLTGRLAAHNSGRGARYTRGRGPVELVFSEVFADRGEALGYEAALKKLSRAQKLALIGAQNPPDAEYLTIYDRNGTPCGTRPRAEVHRQGLRHAVVHLWVVSSRAGVPGVWMQQRAFDRPLYPGCYDLTATGHIDPGEMPAEAICREAREESGLSLTPDRLRTPDQPLVQQYDWVTGERDDELAWIYLWQTDEEPVFAPGPEVVGMHWMPLTDLTALLDGAAAVTLPDGREIGREQVCCLRPAEWETVRALLEGENGK